jgi:hypothetical protein
MQGGKVRFARSMAGTEKVLAAYMGRRQLALSFGVLFAAHVQLFSFLRCVFGVPTDLVVAACKTTLNGKVHDVALLWGTPAST